MNYKFHNYNSHRKKHCRLSSSPASGSAMDCRRLRYSKFLTNYFVLQLAHVIAIIGEHSSVHGFILDLGIAIHFVLTTMWESCLWRPLYQMVWETPGHPWSTHYLLVNCRHERGALNLNVKCVFEWSKKQWLLIELSKCCYKISDKNTNFPVPCILIQQMAPFKCT